MSILRFVPNFCPNRLLPCLILVQVDPTSGRIIIDGIDISTIGIHDLRSRLVGILYKLLPRITHFFYQTFIPQASAWRNGTILFN